MIYDLEFSAWLICQPNLCTELKKTDNTQKYVQEINDLLLKCSSIRMTQWS